MRTQFAHALIYSHKRGAGCTCTHKLVLLINFSSSVILSNETSLVTLTLSRDEFPNGRWRFIFSSDDIRQSFPNSYVIHNNWIMGIDTKVSRLRAQALWYVDERTQRRCVKEPPAVVSIHTCMMHAHTHIRTHTHILHMHTHIHALAYAGAQFHTTHTHAYAHARCG